MTSERTPEQNISTGFHRRGLTLSYLFTIAIEDGSNAVALLRLRAAIQAECEQLGIEPMDTTTFETWEGRAPGHDD